MNYLEKLRRKHPRWGIPNLMLHITILTAVVYVFQFVLRTNILQYLFLNRDEILHLELWRIISFIVIPLNTSLFGIILILYMYYFIGSALESEWGVFKFTAYYLICMICTIIAAMLSGGNYNGFYVNLSMLLAFAYLYPNQEFLLFLVIPVKAKYIAYFYLAYLLFRIFTGDLIELFSIIASLAGFVLFFGNDLYLTMKNWLRKQKYRRQIR